MLYKIKRFIRDNEKLMIFLSAIYRLLSLNLIIGRRNVLISWSGVFARRCKFINHGKNNEINIGKGCRLNNCKIQIFGDNNTVNIDRDCVGNGMDLWVSNGSYVSVGHNTHFSGKIHIACIEGRKVRIGNQCLFSNEITFRTGDSHSIINKYGERINPSEDIQIGNHVWIGQQVTVLKGAEIGSNSIIGTRALVTGRKFEDNVILAGSPAKIIRTGVLWNPELL